jgi:hypothetical protein
MTTRAYEVTLERVDVPTPDVFRIYGANKPEVVEFVSKIYRSKMRALSVARAAVEIQPEAI